MTARWWLEAACLGTGEAMWFPPAGHATKQAAAFCRTCPVRAACLKDAADMQDGHGIRAGLTPAGRECIPAGLPLRRVAVILALADRAASAGQPFASAVRDAAAMEPDVAEHRFVLLGGLAGFRAGPGRREHAGAA